MTVNIRLMLDLINEYYSIKDSCNSTQSGAVCDINRANVISNDLQINF